MDEIAIKAAESTDFSTWCMKIIGRLGSFVTEDALLIKTIKKLGSSINNPLGLIEAIKELSLMTGKKQSKVEEKNPAL